MTRKILHLDLDAFFCSVEELNDPTLKGKVFAVGGSPQGRGVITSCSYAARMLGVRSAMPAGKALKICPDIIFVHGSYGDYEKYSHQVMDVLHTFTPLVEQVSIDEAFLDVSDLPQSSEVIARQIQAKVTVQVHLPCSIGGATTKLTAKIATDAGKAGVRTGHAPCAITIVAPGKEEEFLAPLPVSIIWGVGPKLTARLKDMGIFHIHDIQAMNISELRSVVGNGAEYLYKAVRGLHESPVNTERGIKSISQERTYGQDTSDPAEIESTIRRLTEMVARRMRDGQLCGSTVRLKIRLSDFSTYTRQTQVQTPTNVESVIQKHAIELFRAFFEPGQKIRLIGVGVSGLGESWHQMILWETKPEKEMKLYAAVDELRNKFGKDIIRKGKVKTND